jgi:hypothetical protein
MAHYTGSKFGWLVESNKVRVLAKFQHANLSRCGAIDARTLQVENLAT